MKRIIYPLLATGALLSLTGCASDEPIDSNHNDGTVTFTVSLPEIGTRAFGDAGTINCDELVYTVFDSDGNAVIVPTESKDAFGKGVLTDNVTLQLVANQAYKIVFYAHNSNSAFSSYTDGKLSVDYTKANVNSELDDAFYASYDFTADGTAKSVTLSRPFAQLNIGTDDLDNAAVAKILSGITTTLTVSQGLQTGMDLLTGTTSSEGTSGEVSFTPEGVPSVNTDFPVSGYSNLLSVYLLVPSEQDIIDATCVFNNGSTEIRTLNLSATPVRMNYRTNVYGSLLTSQQPFEVTIQPSFADGYGRVVIDGVSYKAVTTSSELTACLSSGEAAYVPSGVTVDMSDWNPGNNMTYTDATLLIDGVIDNLSVPLEFRGKTSISGSGSIKLLPNTFNYMNGFVTFYGNESDISGITIDGTGNSDLNVSTMIEILGSATSKWENVTLRAEIPVLSSTSESTIFDNCVFESSTEDISVDFARDFNTTFNNCCIINSKGMALDLDNIKSAGYGKGKAVFNGGAIISHVIPDQPIAVLCAIVDVTFNGTAIYCEGATGYSIGVVPFGEHDRADDMILNLSGIITNGKIVELDYNGATIEEIFTPLEGDYFTYTDKSTAQDILGESYTFPWMVSGKYHKKGDSQQ